MKIFWYSSVSIFSVMHPEDPHADGRAVSLDIGDFFFIGNKEDFIIYAYAGYDSTTSYEDPPNVYLGPNIEGLGYPKYNKVFMSFGLGAMRVELSTSGSFYEGTTVYDYGKQVIVKRQNLTKRHIRSYSNAYTNNDYSPILSNIADWDYDATQLTPEFKTTRLEPEQNSSLGDVDFDSHVAGTITADGSVTVYKSAPIRNDSTKVIAVTSSTVEILDISISGGVATGVSLSPVKEYSFTSLGSASIFTIAVGGPNKEFFAIGDPYYDNSKTNQGRVLVFKVASDWTITFEGQIDDPKPAGDTQFGTIIALSVANDSNYPNDTHVAVTRSSRDDIYIHSIAQSLASVTTFTLDRNDTIQNMDGSEDFICGRYIDDSASDYYALGTLTFASDTWSLTINTTPYIYSNNKPIALAKNRFITCASTTAFLYNEAGTSLDSLTITADMNNHYGCYNALENFVGYYDTSSDVIELIEFDSSTDTLIGHGTSPSGGYVTYFYSFIYTDAVDEEDQFFVVLYANATYTFPRPATFSYSIGRHFAYMDVDWPITWDDPLAFGAIFTTNIPTSSSITFVLSFDEGDTWQTSYGGANIDITEDDGISPSSMDSYITNSITEAMLPFRLGIIMDTDTDTYATPPYVSLINLLISNDGDQDIRFYNDYTWYIIANTSYPDEYLSSYSVDAESVFFDDLI